MIRPARPRLPAILRPSRRSAPGPARLLRGPVLPDARAVLRVVSLNVRHGRGAERRPWALRPEDFRSHADRVGAFLRATGADVMALQEVDGPSCWSGRLDHAESILRALGPADLAHGIHFGLDHPRFPFAYGTALLSRVSLGEVLSASFGTRPVDTKGLVVAGVRLDGRPLDVVSIHLDVLRASRRRQAEEAVRLLARRRRPLVLLGDLNSTGARARGAAGILIRGLGLRSCPEHGAPTYPAWKPRRRLDWILASPEIAIRAVPLSEAPVSDHRALAAEVSWATPSEGVDEPDDRASRRAGESDARRADDATQARVVERGATQQTARRRKRGDRDGFVNTLSQEG